MDPGRRSSAREDLESTVSLFRRIRRGDADARETLVARYFPALRRWARGQLPARARHLADTDDLVQNAFIRALDRLGRFEPRREGAFFAYLRQILRNQIRDQLRKAARGPEGQSLPDDLTANLPSPLETTIVREDLEAYDAALADLPDRYQAAILLKIEFGLTHREIADALGCPSPDAARMLVARAIVRLSEVMDAQRA